MNNIEQKKLFSLELLKSCPICSSKEINIFFTRVEDKIFFTPGSWSIYKCQYCLSGFLNPRPSENTIKNAYKKYYTHIPAENESYEHRSLKNICLKIFADGYREHKFGSSKKFLPWLSSMLALFLPGQKLRIDSGMRNLPPGPHGRRLLDIGCGSGEFLLLAKNVGWEVMGVDPDPKAVEVASSRGVNVRLGGVNEIDINCENKKFDFITISHVIEHVHNPISLLKSCYELLNKGGAIWIETPNFNSLGSGIYGIDWRGLEVPRHLTLFNRGSLGLIIEKAGFTSLTDEPYRPLCLPMFMASEAIYNGTQIHGFVKAPKKISRMAKEAEKKCKKDVKIREFIAIKAIKK